MDVTDQRTTSVDVTFSAGVYALDAIKKAAYRFAATAAVDIRPAADACTCTLNFAQPLSVFDAERVANEFKTEVLDQDLRQSIATETAPIRNAILAYAFSKTGLQGGE